MSKPSYIWSTILSVPQDCLAFTEGLRGFWHLKTIRVFFL